MSSENYEESGYNLGLNMLTVSYKLLFHILGEVGFVGKVTSYNPPRCSTFMHAMKDRNPWKLVLEARIEREHPYKA